MSQQCPSASGRLPGYGTRPSGHCDPKTERQCKRETVEECVRILARARVESTTNVKGPCRYAFNASFTHQTVDTPLPAIFAALWIECPPFNKRTMGSQYLNGPQPGTVCPSLSAH